MRGSEARGTAGGEAEGPVDRERRQSCEMRDDRVPLARSALRIIFVHSSQCVFVKNTTDLRGTTAAFAPRAMLTTTRAAREALRRGLGLTPVRRLSGTTGGASGAPAKPKDGRRQAEEMTPEQIEELSVFRATGGLVMAATGGIGVFVIGAAATLGVASGAAHLLGARQPL